MSEMMWTYVEIVIPATWDAADGGSRLVRWLDDEIGDGVKTAGDGWTCWGFSGETNYGFSGDAVSTILEWCEEHHVPYVAADDGKYEIPGSRRVFNGRTAEDFDGTTDQVTMTAYTARALGSYDAILRWFERANANATDFSVGHLPAVEPDNDEAEGF